MHFNTAIIQDRGDEFRVTVKDHFGKITQTDHIDFNSATKLCCGLPGDYTVEDQTSPRPYRIRVDELRRLYPKLL